MNLKKVLCLGLMLTPTLGVQSVFAAEKEIDLNLNNPENNINNENTNNNDNTTEIKFENKLNKENDEENKEEEIDIKEPPEKYIANIGEKLSFEDILTSYAGERNEELSTKDSEYSDVCKIQDEKLKNIEFVAKTVLADMVRQQSFSALELGFGKQTFSTITLPNRDFLKVLKDVGDRFKKNKRMKDYELFLTYYSFGQTANRAYLAGPCIVQNGHNCLANLLHPVRQQFGLVYSNLETVQKFTEGLLKQKQNAGDELNKLEARLNKEVSDLKEIHKKQIEGIQKSFKEIFDSQQQVIGKLQAEVKEKDDIINRLSREVEELKKSRIQQTVPQTTTSSNRSIVTSSTNGIGTRRIITQNNAQSNIKTEFGQTIINQVHNRNDLHNKSGNRNKSHSRLTNKDDILSRSNQIGSRIDLNMLGQNAKIAPQNTIKLGNKLKNQSKLQNPGLGSRIDLRRNNISDNNQNIFTNSDSVESLKPQIENNQNNDIRTNQGNLNPQGNTDTRFPPNNVPPSATQTETQTPPVEQEPNNPRQNVDYLELVKSKITVSAVESFGAVEPTVKRAFKRISPSEVSKMVCNCFVDYQGAWTKDAVESLIKDKCTGTVLESKTGVGEKLRNMILAKLFPDQQ